MARYHQSKRDRREESRGMKSYESSKRAQSLSEGGYYQGPQDREAEERRDSHMIHEDLSAVANLPQNVIMRPWPKGGRYLPEHLDDTIRGIDHQMDKDGSKMYEHGHVGYEFEMF